jgi:hypothetical protein
MRVIEMSGERQLWLLSALILIAALLVSPGFFLVDEAVYHLGARALSDWGSLGIDTRDIEQFQSGKLTFRLLIDGPHGLTPQYPAGSAVLTAPLLPLIGDRAFILLNALAAVFMLFTVRAICLSQFKDERIARIAVVLLMAGTFWAEYAMGIWPHMVSAFLALQAYWFALRCLEGSEKGIRYALLSGLLAGSGMLFRLDAALAIAGIALILTMYAPRLLRSSLWFGAGILPSLALTSWLNYLKFGTANPFSYGKSGGNLDVASYAPFLAVLCLGFALLILWRRAGTKINHRITISVLPILAGVFFVIPETRSWLLRFGDGFLALVVDLRTARLINGVNAGPGDTVMFWGLAKKALGQSMPWIGLMAIMVTGRIPANDRRVFATLLVMIATMTTPFILAEWHGGGCSNMRYFLPAVPLLCILCAKLWADVWQSIANPLVFTTLGIWLAVGIGVTWSLMHPSGYVGVQQIVSTYVLLATAMVSIAAGASWKFRQNARKLLITLLGAGFVLSMASALADFLTAQNRRASSQTISDTIAGLPPKALIIALPEWTTSKVGVNGFIVMDREPVDEPPDEGTIRKALKANYRVYTTSYLFHAPRDVPPGLEAVPTYNAYPGARMIELRRSSADRP